MRHLLLLLLLLLLLTACSGMPGRDPTPQAANAGAVSSETPPPASAPPPALRPAPHSAARSTAPIYVPPAEPIEVGPDQLIQARADCWMQVERQKLRDLDRRIAFVDKCVADTMKKL